MISKENNTILLEFGTGDICVNSLICKQDKTGNVGFKNQLPRLIGSEGDIKIGQPVVFGDFDVIMSFTKPESIDVVIRALEDAKKYMFEEFEQ